MKKRKGEELHLIETFGVGGLLAYMTGVCQGYVKGFSGEHRYISTAGRVLACALSFVIVFTVISMAVPMLSPFGKDTEIAMAAEEKPDPEESEKQEEEGTPEEGSGQASENPENQQEVSVPTLEELPEAEQEEILPEPLDDSIMEPSDLYAEQGSKAVFKAYHPKAQKYQWEIYDTEAEEWTAPPQGVVSEHRDELQREISTMELLADQEKQVRCQITVESGTPVTYDARLCLLSGSISSISAEKYHAEAGQYAAAEDIPVEVVYQDGTQETVTGLNGLCFLDQSESSQSGMTETGNIKETITTVRTAREYDHIEVGSKEETLLYRNGKESMDIPVSITGIDKTAPQITDFTISEFEVSNVDQDIPVTVTIQADDDITPLKRLMYAFLPEGKELQEEDWRDQPVFQAEITKNGVWKAFCRDEAGNIAEKEQEIVAVDTKAPVIRLILETKEDAWCPENKIFVSAEDELSVEYRYLCENTGEDSGWVIESSKSVSQNGDWIIQVRDAAGNVAEEKISINNIDVQAPMIRSITEKEGEAISNEE